MSPLYELAKEGVDLSTMVWQTETLNMAYSTKVIGHYENPATSARCRKTIKRRNRARRRPMRRRDEAAGQGEPRDRRHRRCEVQDVRMRVRTPTPSLATEWLKGKIGRGARSKHRHRHRASSLPPVKIHCSVLRRTPSRRPSRTTEEAGRGSRRKSRAADRVTESGRPFRLPNDRDSDQRGAAHKIHADGQAGHRRGRLRVGVKGGGCWG